MIAPLLVWSAFLACQSPAPARASATLIYTDHWEGEIEPCG